MKILSDVQVDPQEMLQDSLGYQQPWCQDPADAPGPSSVKGSIFTHNLHQCPMDFRSLTIPNTMSILSVQCLGNNHKNVCLCSEQAESFPRIVFTRPWLNPWV